MNALKVLIVDDEPGMRLGAVRSLANFAVGMPEVNAEVGFAAEQAGSGEEALRKLASWKPDILLLDHKLPGMSGLDVLERILADGLDVLTIMITAYASLDVAISATKKGAYDFLAKPFTPEELRGAVRKAARHVVLQREAQRLAREKRQVRFQFISVLAHELKAPLNAIDGYLHIMKEGGGPDNPEGRIHMVERCLSRTEGMRKLIADLLDLTRIESGQKKRDLAEVDVVAVAASAVETAKPSADERLIAIELHAPASLAMTADAGELEIIFNNLVSNAVKYNRDGGRVDVTVEEVDADVRIAVADTGIGMSEEDAAKLFGEFVRIRNDRTKNIAGSGLGLSIVRRLASLYGGTATVTSAPGVGSTFVVSLKRNAVAEDVRGASGGEKTA